MLHVVLVEPEIPANTGNIARTCAATGSVLHLVKPLGFDISDKAVKRAGLDYWHLVDVRVYENLDDFYDYEKYGFQRMNEEDGMFTDRGYIAYKGYSSLREIMNGDQSSHMKMGDMT